MRTTVPQLNPPQPPERPLSCWAAGRPPTPPPVPPPVAEVAAIEEVEEAGCPHSRDAQFRTLQMTMMGRKGGGCREENQDTLIQRRFAGPEGELLLLAVSDGVSRCPDGGGVARFLIDQHLALDPLFEPGRPVRLSMEEYLQALNTRFYQEYMNEALMLESAATLSVSVLEGSSAHCFWVGDSPIYFAQKIGQSYHTRQLTVPDLCGRLLIDCFGSYAPFELKYVQAELAVGDVLVVATDGVAETVEEFSWFLNQHGPSHRLLEILESGTREREYYDDATLVLAERIR